MISILLSLLACPLFATELKTNLLPEKMGQLLAMREKAASKSILADEILGHLKRRMDELRQEIVVIQQEKKIVSYPKAVQSARIKHDILLLGKLQAYCTKLHGEIEKLKTAQAKLDFLYQLTKDDLKIIETLDYVETAGLIKQIDQTINDYAWLSQTHLFEAKGMALPEPRKIWRDIIVKK